VNETGTVVLADLSELIQESVHVVTVDRPEVAEPHLLEHYLRKDQVLQTPFDTLRQV